MRIRVPVLLALVLGANFVAAATPAVTVNGFRLENWEADRELAGKISNTMFHRRIPPERMRELRREALDGLILKELKRQWAEHTGLEVDENEVTEAIRTVRERFADQAAYRAALAKKGISEETFRRAFERDAAAAAADRLIEGRVEPPTPEDVRKYYIDHRDRYTMPESRRVVHLLVFVDPGSGSAERDRAEERARELAVRARAGTPLKDLVDEASKGLPPKYGDQVGDLGFIHRGTLMGGLDDAVFSAPVWAVVGPERSLYGFHVFQVLETKEERPLPFDEVRDAIAGSIERSRRAEAMEAFERGLRDDARIETGSWVGRSE